MAHEPKSAPERPLAGVPVTITATGRAYTSATDYMRQPEVRAQMKEIENSELWKRIADRQRGSCRYGD